ncbi:MAG: dihydroorotate oxidase B, catalytic subunit [Candidatus Methanoperedens nitroreducens]|uniref:Dihydroorotate dehydrogenase n=1 Tax=Candidatus Methanoperedens nitratireducens TaxID=1392998 RepID=A0A0P8C6D4_9EURY|nr:dihydroorotate dehydrogenase [Candidatus Methanoperedens sp. BLZ2]KAB2947322.1 MAG: dihydroorotate dehydrogenase [Candidatus Methanoperedens sp.]KPQ42299.1 MAG: dihydroorotate oxidase B, catalytic subunit [Candidatus Methanoperedens sp. BLZ1]MBZ0175536.1 dihydroorotate dehydrogenase [Candidatus Methanoperedens nitroreducens]CAG0963947.1 dihydroorotate dehydrogenase (NAD+) catalytic subunit [Methanosarcinales archaeon]MCX9080268.1 dihydroorotate dehydrogenase [Candidatus Methanoperedens sp.]
MLSLTLTGLKLKNPLLLAAGVMGTTGGSLKRIADNGAAAVITKSLGIEPKTGHANPSMIEVDCGYLNAMGLPNPSYKNFQQEIDIAQDSGVPVIASIFGGCALDFSQIAGTLDADAFELNVSCPHAHGYGADIGTDPNLVEDITVAVKTATDAPVWVKLTPNVTDIKSIGLAAQRGGADAVVAINTVRGMAIDIESGYPLLGNRFGGLSGRAIKPAAIKCVYDLYDALDIPVIGVGGISDWKDAVEFIMAGALAVEIGSAVGNNINIFNDISKGMETFLAKKEWTFNEIYGMAHKI